jgi:hypothetical protein
MLSSPWNLSELATSSTIQPSYSIHWIAPSSSPSSILPVLAETKLIEDAQYDRVWGYIDSGKKEGAKVLVGGEKRTGKGFYVDPTIFADIRSDMKIVCQIHLIRWPRSPHWLPFLPFWSPETSTQVQEEVSHRLVPRPIPPRVRTSAASIRTYTTYRTAVTDGWHAPPWQIFGPVLSVGKFKTEEEAIALANATTYGLGAGLHSSAS